MILQALAFYLFAFVVMASGAMVVVSRNPVYSVLFLILAFFNAAALFVLIGAEFIAMILVIVYVGAVAVLVLFVVMMLDITITELREGFPKYLPIGALIALVLLMELVLGAGAYRTGALQLGKPDGSAAPLAHVSNIEAIGALLYSRYLFIFEASGVVLLVAMIGAIVLTHRQRSDVRGQNIAKQNARRPDEATHNVSPEVGKGVTL